MNPFHMFVRGGHMFIEMETFREIWSLVDLPKVKLLVEGLKMKMNKSKIARELWADRRTINMYIEGFTRKITKD